MKQTALIVGQWYKTKAGSYVKYSHTRISDGVFVSSENISYQNNTYSTIPHPYGYASQSDNFTKADISEFEQYLPENHPDKIKPIIIEDLSYIEPLKKLLENL